MRVFEVLGHGEGAPLADVFECGFDRQVAGVGFWGGCHVNGGLAEGYARFGHADFFDDVESGGGDGKGARVGVADVLGGEDRDAPRDETRVFAGFEHPRDPVDGGVGVGAAHGFDEGGGGIVV